VQQGGLAAIDGKLEPRLVTANELGIDARQQPAIEQSAMLVALGEVDAVALAKRIEAARCAGVPAPGKRQRIDHAVPPQQGTRAPVELGIEKAEIESGVVHDQHGAVDEGEHLLGEFGEAWLVAQKLGREPMHLEGGIGHLSFGIDVVMPDPPRGNAVDQLDAADLDDAVTVERIEPGRFGIEHDLAQRFAPPRFSQECW
jgi:hypothetical protein